MTSHRTLRATRRSHAALLPLLALAPFALGCLVPSPGVKEETRYAITQQARLPAPEGPRAIGTMVEPGKTFVQASGHYNRVNTARSPRDREALGHLVQDRALQARLGAGIGQRFELGLSASYSHNAWVTPTSDLVPEATPEGYQAGEFSGGLQSRLRFAGTRRFGLAALYEADLGAAHFERTTQITRTYSFTGVGGNETQFEPHTRSESESQEELFWAMRGGVQGFLGVTSWLHLQGGVLAQNQPRYWAHRVVGTVCERELFEAPQDDCQGDTPETIGSRDMMLLGTLFGGASLHHPSLPLSAHIQAHYHPFAPDFVRQALPFGASFAMRLTL